MKHKGKRLASIRATAGSLRLTLGPGFGACFPADLKLRTDGVELVPRTLDKSTGRYAAIVLTLTEKSHIAGARKAVDMIMKSAGSGPPGGRE